MLLLSKLLHFHLMSWIFKPTSSLKIVNLHMNMKANTCKYTGRTFRQTKQFGTKCFQKNRQKFAKSPNQNICSQTLSKFAKFPESGDTFANMATLTRHRCCSPLCARRSMWFIRAHRATAQIAFDKQSTPLLGYWLKRGLVKETPTISSVIV